MFKTDQTQNVRILVEISDVMRVLKVDIERKAGVKTTFYAKDDAKVVGCYVDTVINLRGQKLAKCVENGNPVLIPVNELENRLCFFYAILQSRSLKASTKTSFLSWGLFVSELKIAETPEDISVSVTEWSESAPDIRFCTISNVD